MNWLDWAVIAGYMVSMLAIGEYYARRTKNTEDYLLGNRRMGSFSVGLSLFASLFSTITYLAKPGEMIKHGPMAFAIILGFPLAYVVLGYALIPCFMRLRVTSAYEILEQRFGLSVRMLGSMLFLTLRMLWMGLIIYETASKVLIPVTQLDAFYIPHACILMGIVTVVYTSAGGLKAVVMTDAVQSFILLFGAVLTLLVITWSLGGAGGWWPSGGRLEHWDPAILGIDSKARFTLTTAIMSGFLWWVCTGGSDQIAIQRYLATRDVQAARRVLSVSLVTNFFTSVLLALVGLSLLGYFQTHPELLLPGTSVDGNADSLFTRFIVIGLPAGITGLIIAALLAAAMSSLSSGLNSSALVIAVDFLERLRKTARSDAQKMRETKTISWVIGVITVVASMFIGKIPGNILDRTFTTSNLLIAPLFVLFVMALFVPWATTFGTWVAALASTFMAIVVGHYQRLLDQYQGLGLHESLDYDAYLNFLNLTPIWIMPVSLLAGVVMGCLASLLPIGRRCPMLDYTEQAPST